MSWRLEHGDALSALPRLADASVDAVVADPPYGIGFQGHEWEQPGRAARHAGDGRAGARTTIGRSAAVTAGSYDLSLGAQHRYQQWTREWAQQALRVLKPGGYLASFGAPRTWHRLAVGLEDAGLELRDTLVWLFGGGLPKSRNLSGDRQGFGTALKPAWEPIVLARAPLAVRSVRRNADVFGTGALNIDAGRITVVDLDRYERNCSGDRGHAHSRRPRTGNDLHAGGGAASPAGRWPANVVLSHEADCGERCAPGCVAAVLDELVGDRPAGGNLTGEEPSEPVRRVYRRLGRHSWFSYGDHGGPSRFYYCAKTSSAEREAGLRGRLPCLDCGRLTSDTHPGPRGPEPCRRNSHPTVKPLELIRWLCRLLVPPGGTVLDPFAGSGTTGAAAALEGLDYVGIEREPYAGGREPKPYIALARARVAWWAEQPRGLDVERILGASGERLRHGREGQLSLDDLPGEAA